MSTKMSTYLLTSLILLTLDLPCIPAEPCVWPQWFDLSSSFSPFLLKYAKYEKKSWQTQAVIQTDIQPMVNWFVKSKTIVAITGNRSLEIISWIDKEIGNSSVYECERNFGKSYLLKKTGLKDRFEENIPTAVKYRCMELTQRSRFVAQWRLGVEMDQPQDCQGQFAPVSPWPLVYFPFQDSGMQDEIWKSENLFKEYPACPSLGGYLMRVFDEKGTPVIEKEQCKNDYPSSRFEMECVSGEGIRITASAPCRQYATGDRTGAKFSCLANWEDNKYRYSLLMPDDKMGIRSFHCLRMNKTDPTSGNVLLFLDTVCRPDNPEVTDTYFRIDLRRHTVRGICGDLSDQCNEAQCHNTKYWCAGTCNSCSNISEPIPIDGSIRGRWILHSNERQREFIFTEKKISLPEMGTFHVYGTLSKRRKMCARASLPLEKETFEYALGTEVGGNGCGPRVTQLRAKRVSESVLVVQYPGTAPLRPNEHFVNSEEWCHNNFQDIGSYRTIFKSHWPQFSAEHFFSFANGAYTLITSSKTKPVKCSILDGYYQTMINNMKFKMTLKSGDRRYNCNGESHFEDLAYKISYQCDGDGPSGAVAFECLAGFDVSSDYKILVLEASSPNFQNHEGVPTKENFYCLFVPKRPQRKSPWFYNTAGECDIVAGSKFHQNLTEPIARITPVEFLISSGNELQTQSLPLIILYVFIFLLI